MIFSVGYLLARCLLGLADPAHPTRLGPPLTGPADFVDSMAFSPDGRTLAAGSYDDKVWLWNRDVDDAIQRTSSHSEPKA